MLLVFVAEGPHRRMRKQCEYPVSASDVVNNEEMLFDMPQTADERMLNDSNIAIIAVVKIRPSSTAAVAHVLPCFV